ncbi:MAG: glycosyltransferase family 9 protein [Bdellovibrionales bacterium]|nr:glycosyltransferase family 9 protein [Bdellovibrionales bacterium]
MSASDRTVLPTFISATARILIVRPDRLGDVVLSTPVFEVVRRHYPKAKIVVLAQARVAPILRGLSSVDEVLEFAPEGRHSGWFGFWRLVSELRRGEFALAVVLQAPALVAWALLLARIPIRIGPWSKWYSFLVYNRGVRQRRSQVDMHEADYNLQLLQPLRISVGSKTVDTRIAVSTGAQQEVDQWLSSRGISSDSRVWVAMHPGMGGSALNWPESQYLDLAQALLTGGYGVVVTGGPGEQGILDRFMEHLGKEYAGSIHVYGGQSASDVQRLAAVYRRVQLVIAPSTGPLHVAVAVGSPVLSFYPPIRVQSARRWGPYRDTHAVVLTPEVYCGQEFRCAGQRCASFPCMKSISVDRALMEVSALVSKSK